jgi:betaine-aldehyde dehydrogenase
VPASNTPTGETTRRLPTHRDLYYNGSWHPPFEGEYLALTSPGSEIPLGRVAHGTAADAHAAIEAAQSGFRAWRDTKPTERAKVLKQLAQVVRDHARELAWIDAADCGNPMTAMLGDAEVASSQLDFFAGLVSEMKGSSVPMGPDAVNFSVREPLGVVCKILPFNHPFMFCAGKIAAPLAAGNTVVVKPPEQAPLSALRFAELVGDLLPPGVFNVVTGGRDAAAVLASHPAVAMVSLIGSVQTGRAIMRAAADTIKPLLLELGGKNALIAYPDADPAEVAHAVVAGMNFTWCGQSCGSTSRAMIHNDIYDAVLALIPAACAAFRPGDPTDPATTMGAIVSQPQYERVLSHIAAARSEGARLISGGRTGEELGLAGYFVEPTVFADVTESMRIEKEEIFGPVLAVSSWHDEDAMLDRVNAVEYGLTCSIWTNDLTVAHRTANRVAAGYVWINETSKHFLGAPFGGYKMSGLGREECLAELLSYTQEKNIHVNLGRRSRV